MKTLIALIIIPAFSVLSVAQNIKTENGFSTMKFNNYFQNDSTGLTLKNTFIKPNEKSQNFAISPKFQTDNSGRQGFSPNFQNTDSLRNSYPVPEFRMPVASGGSFTENMPVAVPDSSVHYYLKIKKIDGVNPLEKSWRRK